MRGGERELREEIVPAGFLPVDVLQRIEPLDLAGKADRELLGVELRNRRSAGSPGEERAPSRIDVGSDGGHQAKASDNDTMRQATSRSSRGGSSWRRPPYGASRRPRRG